MIPITPFLCAWLSASVPPADDATGAPTGELEVASMEPVYSFSAAGPQMSEDRAGGGDGWSLAIGFGLVSMEDADGPEEAVDFDEGWTVPLALIRRFGTSDGGPWAFDLEFEGYWTDQDADSDEGLRDISVVGAAVNGIADYAMSERASLYAGAGIGASWVDLGTEDTDLGDFEEDEGPYLTWQVKAGLNWRATDTLTLGLGYRFRNIDDVEIDDDEGDSEFDLETQQQSIELGLRFVL